VSDTTQPIVAVIADTYSDYHKSLVSTLSKHFSVSGFGTLYVACYGMSAMAEPSGSSQFLAPTRNHELADYNIVGHVILTASRKSTSGDFQYSYVIDDLKHLPTVSLGADIPGISSVVHREALSMEALMAHMTEESKRKRFVFLRGRKSKPDSHIRESVFRRHLEQKSIAIDEDLILDCDFSVGKAYAEINKLLNSGARFDAVVAANDAMAGSAIRALNEYGISVPDDVIVSGFDGSREAVTMHPPLTTVKQDVEGIAEEAADELKRLINVHQTGGLLLDERRSIEVDCDLIIRPSTRGNRLKHVARVKTSNQSGSKKERLNAVHEHLLSAYLKLSGARPAVKIEQRLVNSIVDTLSSGSNELPLTVVDLLREHPVNIDTLEWWQFTYRVLTLAVDKFPSDLVHVDALIHHVNTISHIGSALWSVRTRVEFDHETSRQTLDSLLLNLASTSNEAEIFDVLERGFGEMKINYAWIRLSEEVAETQSDSGLVFAVIDGVRHDTQDIEGQIKISPENIIGQYPETVFVHYPLHVGSDKLGHLIIDQSDLVLLKLEAITAGISQALRHSWQITDLEVKARGLREINESLSTLARFDSLTNLPNRKQFHEFLEQSFELASENGYEVGLLFFDLDGFKRINDTLGHSAGDHLLRIVAKRVSGILRAGDRLCRLGGDEFTVIISDSANEGLFERIADRILEAVSKPCTLGNQVVNVSASIGVASYPSHGRDTETLIRNADTAMYHAKSNGKNCVAWYTTELNSEAISQLKLDQDMRIALADDMFLMHYQPRICLKNDSLTGFEALMRWQGKGNDKPIAGPDRFIPVAEQTGFISDLETFALKAVCEQASSWLRQGFRCRTAINLSAKRLKEANIVNEILGTIAEHKLSPEYLEFEVTESAMMTDIDSTISKLTELRDAGIHLSIDDFGTGYSSMNYLKQLPVTSLKIDRSFLVDIADDDSLSSADASIVRAVIALGKSLGFMTVAEGVENEAQLNFLKKLGCDEAQGYFYSQPLSVSAATNWLGRNMLNSTYKLTGS